MERAYTVTEIMRMRISVTQLHFWFGSTSNKDIPNIEAVLQTYLVAGVAPDDLEAAAAKLQADMNGFQS